MQPAQWMPGKDSISLHVYGLDVGRERRICWDEARESYVTFRSGYTNAGSGLTAYLRPAAAPADLPA